MRRSRPQAARPGRGRLKPMRVSESFRDYALDQLSAVRDLRPRAMFGGVGLYAGDVFFGILAADVLYLKTDDTNRSDFEAAGAQPFKPYAGRPMTMAYFSVPVTVLEDAATLVAWARRSIAVASRAAARPAPKRRKPA
jgi:DNA transformation protein